MPTGTAKTASVNIRVSDELKRVIETVAERDERSISQVCERVLREFFLDEIEEEAPLENT
jgi:predicted transcriptional regulator